MRTRFAVLLLASAFAASTPAQADDPSRGLMAVNQPVVTRNDFAMDMAAPDGTLSPTEEARLDGWFHGLGLGYGDRIYVDGDSSGAARADVARVAGRYGMLVSNGAPITTGAVAPGSVRVIVSRTRASVPNCPNWSVPSQPNLENATMSNFGCAHNSNMAAMVANPEDLVHGREGTGLSDATTASRAIGIYRTTPPTGSKGLQDINTKKGN